MTTRKLTVAATMAATAAMLLAACGGHHGGTGNKIEGAQGGSSASAKASPGASAPGVKRPVIDLPPDLHYVFTPERTGDATKDAILFDNAQFIKSIDLAIAHQDPKDRAYQFYAEGPAAAGVADWVKGFVKYKQRTTGTLRVFDRKVDVQKGNTTAELTYCTDESKSYNKELRSGKVDVTKHSKQDYVLYGMVLRKNGKGIWMAESINSTRGASQCQP